MIFSFTATGNTRLVAQRIAQITGDDHISINDQLRLGEQARYTSERPLVFVTPTYCWRIPAVVEKWIEATDFQGNTSAYFVMTCGDGCGNAARYIKKLCQRKGFHFLGLAPVVMPENYLAMFETPNAEESNKIIANTKPLVDDIAQKIGAGDELGEPPVTLMGRLESGPINPLYYAFVVNDKAFYVTDKCISCSKCASLCPLSDIHMVDGKPKWLGHCTHCMACISACPTQAIEYGDKTKTRHRHYIKPNDNPWSTGEKE